MSKTSELEGVVLGFVGNNEPCTAYSVRRMLQASPSAHWSGSAGAIYPLLQRLERAGWIASCPDPDDRRGRRLLELTEGGRNAMHRWMMAASSTEVVANISDAVRARAFFLSSLSPEERRRFVKESLNALRAFLKTTKEDLVNRKAGGEEFSRLAARGGVLQAEARVVWMTELLAHLDEQLP